MQRTGKSTLQALWLAVVLAIALAAAMFVFSVPAAHADGYDSELTVRVSEDEYPNASGESNITFTVPTTLAFTAAPDGTLTGPSSGNVIDNGSILPIYVSSLWAKPESGWNIVADASEASSATTNAVSITIGPTGGQVNISDFQGATESNGKHALTTNLNLWNMAADGQSGDTVTLASDGKINNVTASFTTTGSKFATIRWYVKAGTAS